MNVMSAEYSLRTNNNSLALIYAGFFWHVYSRGGALSAPPEKTVLYRSQRPKSKNSKNKVPLFFKVEGNKVVLLFRLEAQGPRYRDFEIDTSTKKSEVCKKSQNFNFILEKSLLNKKVVFLHKNNSFFGPRSLKVILAGVLA